MIYTRWEYYQLLSLVYYIKYEFMDDFKPLVDFDKSIDHESKLETTNNA